MKHLALIVSLYILSLALAPAIRLIGSISHCDTSCAKENKSEKDADGCQKQICSPFSCCLKTLVLIQGPYKYSQPFTSEPLIRNNFSFKNIFTSFRSFDIWHPPQFN